MDAEPDELSLWMRCCCCCRDSNHDWCLINACTAALQNFLTDVVPVPASAVEGATDGARGCAAARWIKLRVS